MPEVPVWDIATRLFHWLLVLFVTVCLFTGEDEGLLLAIHAYAGFVVLMLLLFRTGWGVIGSPHSRFSTFPYDRHTVWRYVLSLLRFKPEPYVGHNPLGSWMVILMMVVLALTALSGVLMISSGMLWLEDIHESLGVLMQVLVCVHIVGVFLDQFLTGDNLIRAMVNGRKPLPENLAAKVPPLASVWKAGALAVLVVVASFLLFQKIDYAAKVSTYGSQEEHSTINRPTTTHHD